MKNKISQRYFFTICMLFLSMYFKSQENAEIISNAKKNIVEIGNDSLKIDLISSSLKGLNINDAFNIYDTLIEYSIQNNQVDFGFDLITKKCDLGYNQILFLEGYIGDFYRETNIEKYRILERRINNNFIDAAKRITPNINFELAFTIRYLYRLDQRYKQMLNFKKLTKQEKDSIIILDHVQNKITETILDNIFSTYGYPGRTLVGNESATCITFLLHTSAPFTMKYIRLVQNAILSNEISIDVNFFYFLVDKTLHKYCQKTIYGTSWSKLSPLVTDPKEIEELKKLLNII